MFSVLEGLEYIVKSAVLDLFWVRHLRYLLFFIYVTFNVGHITFKFIVLLVSHTHYLPTKILNVKCHAIFPDLDDNARQTKDLSTVRYTKINAI